MNHWAGNCNKQMWIQVYPILQLKCRKVNFLCPNGCVLFLVIYSCSPRNRPFQFQHLNVALLKSTWPLETVMNMAIVSYGRFKVIQHIPYRIQTIVVETIIVLTIYCFFQIDFILIH